MSSSSNFEISLYIPTLKISYSEDKVKLLFWKNGLGEVDRIDFVPIMKTFNDLEPKECQYFKRAFLYLDTRTTWHPDIIKSIKEKKPYKVYPNKDETFEDIRDTKEYWLILKNNSPVPYATTTLNIHQLANNLKLLEAQFAEKETQLAEREAQLAEKEAQLAELESVLAVKRALVTELEAVNTRLSNFNRDITVYDDENTDEMRAYNFVTSFDNDLRMMEQSENEDDCDEKDGHYVEYIHDISKSTRIETDKMTEGMESKSFIIIDPSDNEDEYEYEYEYDDDHYEEYIRSDRFNNDDIAHEVTTPNLTINIKNL